MSLNRRQFLGTGLVAFASRGVPAFDCSASPLNVLMICLDDLNDWCGFLGGHPQAITPNIDALAREGTGFTRAYCVVPLCNPSRVSALTGLSPRTTNVWYNHIDGRALPNIVQHFRSFGYHTAKAGKVFHTSSSFPTDPSGTWDEELPGGWPSPVPAQRPVIGACIDENCNTDAGPLAATKQEMKDFKRALNVAGWLKAGPPEPFFAGFGIAMPHQPWFVPESFFGQFPLEDIQLPWVRPGDLQDLPEPALANRARRVHTQVILADAWKPLVQGYLASSLFADACVGKVLQGLEESGLAGRTLVVLWSDHGYHLGERGHWHKQYPSENALRVPLIFKAPGCGPRVPCRQPVSLLGLAATMAEVAGIPAPIGLDGPSFAHLVSDPDAPGDPYSVSFWRKWNRSVAKGRWRYTRWQQDIELTELYDHETDPHEWFNLANDPRFSQVVAELDAIVSAA